MADNWKSLENELSLEIWAKWNFFVQRKLSAIMSRDDLNYTCQIIALFIHCNEAMKIKNSLWWNDEFAMKIIDFFLFEISVKNCLKKWNFVLSDEENFID